MDWVSSYIDIFAIASWIGSIAFAISGFLVGVRKHLDFMGMFIVAMLTANGGGAVRDVLVGRVPTVLHDASAFLLVIAVMVCVLLLKWHRRDNLERRSLFVISDSIGLVAFSITGAMVGLEAGLGLFGVVTLSFITAVGGGIIRDMMVNEVPSILSSDFYGSIAILVGLILYCLNRFYIASDYEIAAVFLLALLLRYVAWRKGWHLPKIWM